MKIGILGSGRMGGALGLRWAKSGHEVTFSYSRDRRKLEALAREAGRQARAGAPAEAVRDAEVVLVAVPWRRLDEALAEAGSLRGRILLTCSLPMTDDDSDLALGLTTSGAEELARRTPGAPVVAAFGTIPSELIAAPREGMERAAVIYCGGDERAKAAAATLIEDAGFDPVDAGPLRIARYLEPFGLLMGQLAYNREPGPELGYRLVRP